MSLKTNPSLVSVIIPCFNCERWIGEAVESCLNQTYPNLEIIVVDDGSTDRSLEILNAFVPRITLETGSNRGGNVARNRGFALSTGEYIQYLDGDDYLEPDKIARQVRFLKEMGADVVYGDWRYRTHLSDGSSSYLSEIRISGYQEDVVASLLSNWWVFLGAILYSRQVVDQVSGWDETLRAAQDQDFLRSVALSGAKISYQPGCYSIYRRYGAVTVSSSNRDRWVQNHRISLSKCETSLEHSGRLTQAYKIALAAGYFDIARAPSTFGARTSLAAYTRALDELIDKILDLYPLFQPKNETRVFIALHRLFGFRVASHLLLQVRSAIYAVRSKLQNTILLHFMLRRRGIKLERNEKFAVRSAKPNTISVDAT
jgi:glycosyltransferase involved in cell wall biosynthesis